MIARSVVLLFVLVLGGSACGNSSSNPPTVTVTQSGAATAPATNAAATSTSSSTTTPATVTRASLVSCLDSSATPEKRTHEIGFAPPGGALLVGRDGTTNALIVGVYPDPSYANAQARTVVSIAAAYVGKPTAEKNVHITRNVVWFPQHSPFTGQHLPALDKCLAG